MKALSALVVAGFIALGAQTALAQGINAEKAVLDGAQSLIRIRTDQVTYCAQPRSYTPAKCRADFDGLVPKVVEFSSWQALYALALQNNHDAKDIAWLRRKAEDSKISMLELSHRLERDYYPQKVTTGSTQ